MYSRSLIGWIFAISFCIVLSSLAGCTVPRQSMVNTQGVGTTAYKPITPNNERTYMLSQGASATTPALITFSAPIYPQRLVALHLPSVDVAAQLIMNRRGEVHEVRFAPYLGSNEHRKEFEESVREAALAWRFSPLLITQTASQRGVSSSTMTESKPFSLWYMFHFEVKDGKPIGSIEAGNNAEN